MTQLQLVKVFMPPHPLTNFEIKKYYQNDAQLSSLNKPKFNGVYSRNNLPKIKGGEYVINLNEFKSIGTKIKDGAYVINLDEFNQ